MDIKLIDEKIRQLRERETHLRAELDRLMQARRNSEGFIYVEPVRRTVIEGGWNADKIGTLQTSLRSALDRAYAARGISRVGVAA